MSYPGRDRRIHRVFVTRNTEYHVRSGICIGVRDRRTGTWMQGHLALRSRVSGGLRFNGLGGIRPNSGQPSVGESLFFQAAGRDLVTSTILTIERPPKELVTEYAA